MRLVYDASVEITFARAQRSDWKCAVEMFGNCPGMKKGYKPVPKFLPKGLYLSENTNIEMLNDSGVTK